MQFDSRLFEYMNRVREEHGYRTLSDLLELGKKNTIFDIFSVLIGRSAVLGINNIIYPNVVIKGKTSIADSNILFTGTNIQALNGKIEIGSGNEIGENAASIKAVDADIIIKNKCRLMNSAHILDGCYLGDGSQVLGNIKIVNCYLADGESYRGMNPNNRGGVIKGFGSGNSLKIEKGFVINGNGTMINEMAEKQEKYHPNWKAELPK